MLKQKYPQVAVLMYMYLSISANVGKEPLAYGVKSFTLYSNLSKINMLFSESVSSVQALLAFSKNRHCYVVLM